MHINKKEATGLLEKKMEVKGLQLHVIKKEVKGLLEKKREVKGFQE